MFTGIIETIASVVGIQTASSNKTFWLSSPVSHELRIDQSISHDGVCLTVEEVQNGRHRVSAIEETLTKSNLDTWSYGREVNIERCLMLNERLDGHMVQGHTDTIATCTDKKNVNGSWQFRFHFPETFNHLVIEKGSIAVNGISLTLFSVSKNEFSVAIIPHTYLHTNVRNVEKNDLVNIEFDIIGKYLSRFRELMK